MRQTRFRDTSRREADSPDSAEEYNPAAYRNSCKTSFGDPVAHRNSDNVLYSAASINPDLTLLKAVNAVFDLFFIAIIINYNNNKKVHA
jgi:hypothetical protein